MQYHTSLTGVDISEDHDDQSDTGTVWLLFVRTIPLWSFPINLDLPCWRHNIILLGESVRINDPTPNIVDCS